ncbi:MAG TPA: GtrA family protein [Spirillospora sp.]
MSSARPRNLIGRVSAFAVIGALCTVAWLVLYLAFRAAMPPLAANALALVLTTVANTAANRRFTYRVAGPERALRHQLEGGAVFLVGLSLSSGGLALLHAVAPGASRPVEIVAMLGSYALATLVRFALLDRWVFNPSRGPGSSAPPPDTAPTPAPAFRELQAQDH